MSKNLVPSKKRRKWCHGQHACASASARVGVGGARAVRQSAASAARREGAGSGAGGSRRASRSSSGGAASTARPTQARRRCSAACMRGVRRRLILRAAAAVLSPLNRSGPLAPPFRGDGIKHAAGRRMRCDTFDLARTEALARTDGLRDIEEGRTGDGGLTVLGLAAVGGLGALAYRHSAEVRKRVDPVAARVKKFLNKNETAKLPPGWEAVKDEDGETYYYNNATGETMWEMPGPKPPPRGSATAPDAENASLLPRRESRPYHGQGVGRHERTSVEAVRPPQRPSPASDTATVLWVTRQETFENALNKALLQLNLEGTKTQATGKSRLGAIRELLLAVKTTWDKLKNKLPTATTPSSWKQPAALSTGLEAVRTQLRTANAAVLAMDRRGSPFVAACGLALDAYIACVSWEFKEKGPGVLSRLAAAATRTKAPSAPEEKRPGVFSRLAAAATRPKAPPAEAANAPQPGPAGVAPTAANTAGTGTSAVSGPQWESVKTAITAASVAGNAYKDWLAAKLGNAAVPGGFSTLMNALEKVTVQQEAVSHARTEVFMNKFLEMLQTKMVEAETALQMYEDDRTVRHHEHAHEASIRAALNRCELLLRTYMATLGLGRPSAGDVGISTRAHLASMQAVLDAW